MIRKDRLENFEVLIQDEENSDDDRDEDINEGEEAKILTGKVGQMNIARIVLAVSIIYW